MQEIRSQMDRRDVSVMVELVDTPVLVKVMYKKTRSVKYCFSSHRFSGYQGPRHSHSHPRESRLFSFYILIFQKVTTSNLGNPPPRGRRPFGKSWIHHYFSVKEV